MILPDLTWSKLITNRLPSKRSGAASVVYQDQLFIHGGYGDGGGNGNTGYLDDFWCYNFISKKFHQVKVMNQEKPHARSCHAIVISEDENAMYLFGGYMIGNQYDSNLWKYDMKSKIWTEINRNNYLYRRANFVSFVHDKKLFLFGGYDILNEKYLNDLHVFDFKTQSWNAIEMKGTIPSPREGCAWAIYGNKLYLHGGCDRNKTPTWEYRDKYKGDFFELNLDTYEWNDIDCASSPPSPRNGHSALVHGNHMYIFGGQNEGQGSCDDIFCYNFTTKLWIKVGTIKDDFTSYHQYFVAQIYKGDFYIFGGRVSQESREKDEKGYESHRIKKSEVINDFYQIRIKVSLEHTTRLANDLRVLINDQDSADVCFVVEEKMIYGHKCILSVRSDYFRWMLGTDIDLLTNSIQIDDGTSYRVFLQVMEFLYSGRIDNMDNVTELLAVAEKYSIRDLILHCAQTTNSVEITNETAINILLASHRHKIHEIKEDAMNFIIQNWNNSTIRNGMNQIDDIELFKELIIRKQ